MSKGMHGGKQKHGLWQDMVVSAHASGGKCWKKWFWEHAGVKLNPMFRKEMSPLFFCVCLFFREPKEVSTAP